MKKKLLIALLALTLVILLAVTALADDNVPVICGKALELANNINIVYYIDQDAIPINVTETGLLVWQTPQNSYTVENSNAVKLACSGTRTDRGLNLNAYTYTGLAAKQMTDDIYAVAYFKYSDDTYTYSTVYKYSILQYCYNMQQNADAWNQAWGSTTLGQMLASVKAYGAQAQLYFSYNTDRLATADYAYVSLTNGTLPDGTTGGLYAVGEQVTVTANDGYVWADNAATETITITASDKNTTIERSAAVKQIVPADSALNYSLNDDGNGYTVTGLNDHTVTELSIPSTYLGLPVTAIKKEAFKNETQLVTVVVPESVTSMGASVFNGCSSLVSITLPYVGRSASVAPGYTQYPFGAIFGTAPYEGGVAANQKYYYHGADELSSSYSAAEYYIPASLTMVTITGGEIMYGAFWNCTNLEIVTLPSSIASIGGHAFYDCRSLKQIIFTGTAEDWQNITFGDTEWNKDAGINTVAGTYTVVFAAD